MRSLRYSLPLLAALICCIAATKVASPLVGFVLIILAFAFVIEVSTKLFEQAGKTGRLTDHRQ